MNLPSKAESELFLRLISIRNPDLFLPTPKYEPSGLLAEKQKGMGNVYEWLHEGWGLDHEPSPEQIAAALFMEARTQDDCVKAGESDASYPIRLRQLAYQIIDFYNDTDARELAQTVAIINANKKLERIPAP